MPRLAKSSSPSSRGCAVPPLRPWLFRIAHNAALDFLKSHGRKYTEPTADIEDIAGFDDRPDPAVVRAALARFLTLPVSQRSAVIRLLELERDRAETSLTALAELDRYARLFNARDWDGVRGLVSDDCRLDLVSRSQRRGKQVGVYFERYEKGQVTLRVVRLEGQLAFAAYVAAATKPAYFILLEFEGGRVKSIRDYRYVPYIAAEAEFELLTP